MHDKLSTSEANVSPVAWSESAWLHNRLRLRKVQAAIKRFSNAAVYTETACVLREYKCLANSDNVQWWVKANHCVVDQHNGGFLSREILLRASPKQCPWAACVCVKISVPERWEMLIYVCTNMSSYTQGAIKHRGNAFISRPLQDTVRSSGSIQPNALEGAHLSWLQVSVNWWIVYVEWRVAVELL